MSSPQLIPVVFIITMTFSIATSDRWKHAEVELAPESQTRTRMGPLESWPIDCDEAIRSCMKSDTCKEDYNEYKGKCEDVATRGKFTEDACDECRLAAVNLSDHDTGFDVLKCKCKNKNDKCSQQKRIVNDCLSEMVQ
jgi:hypothetical protein